MRLSALLAALYFSAVNAESCPSELIGCCTQIYICADRSFRVVHTAEVDQVAPESLVVVGYAAPFPEYTVTSSGGQVDIATSSLKASVDVASGLVTFYDVVTGTMLSAEANRTMVAAGSTAPDLYTAEQIFTQRDTESIYGGGGLQNGLFNWKDTAINLAQYNTEIAVPFFASTVGYGILWDAYSWTYVNSGGQGLKLTQTSTGLYQASLTATTSGKHSFLLELEPLAHWGASAGVRLNVSNGGSTETVQYWPSGDANMPASLAGRVVLTAGVAYNITLETKGNAPVVTYIAPGRNRFALKAGPVAVLDYYFMHGDSIDGAIKLYRDASGVAALYTKKTYGFWQCRNRYENKSEVLASAKKYRDLYIPVDNIVQDYKYWGSLGWGPQWDPTIYPDPAGMVAELHKENFHFMVSVWSRFDASTTFFKDMQAAGHIINGSDYYDPFSASAREMYYNFSKQAHFDIGVDSIWLDATEAEHYPAYNQQVAVGNGNQYMNPYSLMTTRAIADGLRRDFRTAQGARVFSLTRSAFTGQQRVGAAVWTGDITSSWTMLRRQLYMSLNYQLSGMPYWCQDIGGYFRPGDEYDSPEYHNMLIRWFQFGAFTPIFRVHGRGYTEPWVYGNDTMTTINSTIALRYRFLPYTYSGFHDVQASGSTMQRALVFDFVSDEKTHDIGDQYMWGSSLMVAPIYTAGDPAVRTVYFPEGQWRDFYTGDIVDGGQTKSVSAGLQEIPLYLRMGSIVVLGDVVQHTIATTKVMEVRICDGANAVYSLYEDDGASPTVNTDSTRVVDTPSSIIAFSWNNAEKTLTVAKRAGSFPGMLSEITMNIYVVAQNHGVGVTSKTPPNKSIVYTGDAVVVQL